MSDMESNRISQSPILQHEHPNGDVLAAKVSNDFSDPVLEKRVVRKLDWNIMTLITSLYLLSFLDRSNIGNAKIAGMKNDLHLSGSQYDWLLTIFYIPYILFEWQTLLWKILPPHWMATYVVFFWGAVATCQSATTSWAGMMVCRFLLGVAEAGIPGMIYYLSFFYLRDEIGLRCGIFLSAAPLASCFAGALAYGITSGHAAIASWRLLFLVEGLPVVLIAPIVFIFLPDSPHKARFLSEEERKIALARGVRQVGHSERIGNIQWSDVLATFSDPAAWIQALMYLSCNVSFASLPVFLPQILEDMGFTGVVAQGVSAPPYFLAFLTTLFTTWLADRTQQRGLTIMATSCIGAVGYIITAATSSTGSRYAGVYLSAAGVFPSIANILPWLMNNQGNDNRRGTGWMILNLIGQCGPLVGTNIYPASTAPRYIEGLSICAAFMFFNMILAFSLRTLLAWRNRNLDRKHGTIEEQRARIAASGEDSAQVEGIENFGPMYRYVL